MQQLARLALFLPAAQQAEVAQRLGQNVDDLHLGMKRGQRVLEHHLHMPPVLAQRLAPQREHIGSVERHLACGGRLHAQQHAHQRGFAAAALPHDAERAPAADGQADIIAGGQRAPARGGKPLDQVARLQNDLIFSDKTLALHFRHRRQQRAV